MFRKKFTADIYANNTYDTGSLISVTFFLQNYKVPACIFKFMDIDENFYSWLINEYECDELTESEYVKGRINDEHINIRLIYLKKHKIAVLFTPNFLNKEDKKSWRIKLLFEPSEHSKKIIEKIKSFIIEREVRFARNPISIIINKGAGFDTSEFDFKIDDFDVKLNYGTKFIPVYDEIMSKLNNENKGIILFHGQPGTGKTSMIKYMARQLKKHVLFIPTSLAHCLDRPDFVTFLFGHKNSVLIIEDAEKNNSRQRDWCLYRCF